MINFFNQKTVWGKGQLFAFSAFDGETDFEHGLVLRSTESAILEIKLPKIGGAVVFDCARPLRCHVAGDFVIVETAHGVSELVFADACNVLIRGFCEVVGLTEDYRAMFGNNLTLLAPRAKINPDYLKADFDRIVRERAKWLDDLLTPYLKEEFIRPLYKACSQLKTQLNSPVGNIRHRWTTPDRWPHRLMWLWDSVFHAVALRHIDIAAARETLDAVFDAQQPDGFIPHMIYPDRISGVTQPPVLGFGVKMLQKTAPDRAWLEQCYYKNGKFLNWIFAHRDTDGGGLVEWYIEEFHNCRCGESGMDNSPRFDGAIQLDAPDFNAYLSLECELMAEFAAELGLAGEAKAWQEKHQKLNDLMNQYLWSGDAALYMDYDVVGKQQSTMMSSAGFLPLICGAPDAAMAARMVRHLSDPATFGTPFGVPSISNSQAEFYQKDMWRGPVWININYLIAMGLERYGYPAQAAQLLDRTCVELEKHYFADGTFFEFYDDKCECGPKELLRKGCCDPYRSPYNQVFMDYGWSATLYIDMIFAKLNR